MKINMKDVYQLPKISYNVIRGIYFLFDEDVVVYIGQAINILRRITEHIDKTFTSYSYIECSDVEMNLLERKYIETYSPKYNIMLNKAFLPVEDKGFNLTLKNNLGVLRDNTFIVNIENTTLRIPLVKLKVSYQFVGQKGYLKIKEKYGEITYNNHRYFITHKERDKYNLILR